MIGLPVIRIWFTFEFLAFYHLGYWLLHSLNTSQMRRTYNLFWNQALQANKCAQIMSFTSWICLWLYFCHLLTCQVVSVCRWNDSCLKYFHFSFTSIAQVLEYSNKKLWQFKGVFRVSNHPVSLHETIESEHFLFELVVDLWCKQCIAVLQINPADAEDEQVFIVCV